jgi:alkyl sulfatase BDS1-like metallo-beta-lactamase superfamily hydrolase
MTSMIDATPRPAHPETLRLQDAFKQGLNFADQADFEDARKGFIGTIDAGEVLNAKGQVVASMRKLEFIDGDEAPDTVNPSLWRLARLNTNHGLFEVTERTYQVRGLDIANVTFIEGERGVIVIDPATFVESAAAALALYRKHRGDRPVTGLIYTHSHNDHCGGARGVLDAQRAASGEVPVIAPAGFMDALVGESVLAGVPMMRRAAYQFGGPLPAGPRGYVDSGLGKVTGTGRMGLIPPTQLISESRERHVIDGVEIVFQLTPGSEAPAEMHLFFPQLRALNLAENACQLMHNLCPIRGAKTRDALAWSQYLDEALAEYVPQVDVVYAQHHWPVWGQARAAAFVADQRDMYRYLHDQTIRLMNHGFTPREIAAELMMPNELSQRWHTRGYYGAVAHNVNAIYAHYLGPYDGNPVNLNRHTPAEEGRRYVAYMGGADELLRKARMDYEQGDFRWVAQAMHHLVFAQPDHAQGRALLADAMEQMGYQAESSTWRNAYLLGALEARRPFAADRKPRPIVGAAGVLGTLPIDRYLQHLAARVNGPKAQALTVRFDWLMTDEGSCHRVTVRHGALSHLPGSHGAQADAVLRLDRATLVKVVDTGSNFATALDEGLLQASGNVALMRSLFDCLDVFDIGFNIVEP